MPSYQYLYTRDCSSSNTKHFAMWKYLLGLLCIHNKMKEEKDKIRYSFINIKTRQVYNLFQDVWNESLGFFWKVLKKGSFSKSLKRVQKWVQKMLKNTNTAISIFIFVSHLQKYLYLRDPKYTYIHTLKQSLNNRGIGMAAIPKMKILKLPN